MRIFITGASGYIGHAVAKAFKRNGHSVAGLVRSETKGEALWREEIKPIIGSLQEPQSYSNALEESEVYVHCAFEMSPEGKELDFKTLDFLIQGARKSTLPKCIIYTSGSWVYGNTGSEIHDESFPLNPINLVKWRISHEDKLLQVSSHLLRTVVLRPGAVYGGSGGLTGFWFKSAANGTVSMVGDGKNRWAMIHIEDLARAYVMAAEKEYSRLVLNLTDGSYSTVLEMGQAVASVSKVKRPIHTLTAQQSFDLFGALTEGLLIDQKISNERARRLLGWIPMQLSFIQGIYHYYHSWRHTNFLKQED